jgi:hypothetical protein
MALLLLVVVGSRTMERRVAPELIGPGGRIVRGVVLGSEVPGKDAPVEGGSRLIKGED